ncbi:AlpA family phage regulatory protein, partial [Vibrio parahaemolyticus]|nr:AlpA family phage regulatory protein [Vibrio parahaemolyticus]EHW0650667.1 AlpA family phage regulatory protein [Vibrio parahaemolyticus]
MSAQKAQTTQQVQQAVVPRFYTLKTVMATLNLGRSTTLKLIESGRFPKPVKLCTARNMWPDHEVEKMVKLYSADLSDEELLERVEEIHVARKG